MAAASAVEAAARGEHARLASILRANPGLANVTDENGCSLLQRAAADGHVEVIQLLLQHGVDPNKQDYVHGNTAVHEAAWKGYSRCVATLASHKADLHIRNGGGFAALHLACQNGHNQSCREILLAGGSPDLQNNYGDTSLHTAARYGHAGVTRILISAECKVSEQNKNGDTALHIAAAMGRRKLTRILLEAGCDKSIKNHQGETPKDISARKELTEITNILNTPITKHLKKKEKKNKSNDKLEEIDAPKKDKKKKKIVSFETPLPVQWSPYGCHYYPDTKFFPKPKLSSLPQEPLKKGEQYYLDLAGNIKKGPVGAGYTCYCAPFFKHIEEKMNEDKNDIKRHIERAHEKLDQKVTDLEMKTKGQISELTRAVVAERAMCKERHEHLQNWLTRGICRASERPKKLDFSPKGSLDIAPLKRTRSLEILDSHAEEFKKVNDLIKSFNNNSEDHCSNDLKSRKAASRSTDALDDRTPSTSRSFLANGRTSNCSEGRKSRPESYPSSHTSPLPENGEQNQYNTAEIHVKANKLSISQSPLSMEVQNFNERSGARSRQSSTKSPSSSYKDVKSSDCERSVSRSSQPSPWKSQVLQRTTDDIRKRVLEKELVESSSRKTLDISQDGYIKFPKQPHYHLEDNIDRQPGKSVHEIVTQVEHQQRSVSPDVISRNPTEHYEPPIQPVNVQPSPVKMAPEPLRPAPVLKEKPTKNKRFSLQNLIPFPTRKSFQSPTKTSNNSESSDEEDNPITTTIKPGPMRNANLLQTLPLPNYDTMSSTSQSPGPQTPITYNQDLRSMIPKDAYFHEIPNRNFPYANHMHYSFNETGLPNVISNHYNVHSMVHNHIDIERIPHSYSEHLKENAEVEISKEYHPYPYYNNNQNPSSYIHNGVPDHNFLHSRLESLAINTHLHDPHNIDRESHNDSGYSTKVYGSSQGPSPSLSGHVDDHLSAQRINLANKEGTSSLV